MWPFGPVRTVPTDPAFPDPTESAPVVDAGVEVVDDPVELPAGVVVVDPEAAGVEEQAAAVMARPMTRPIRARPRLRGPGAGVAGVRRRTWP